MAECPLRKAKPSLNDNVEAGEIIVCPDCGVELEVVSVNPVVVEPAPEVEEDWGE